MPHQMIPATWHHTLEEWAELQFGRWERLPHPRPVDFAPFEAHKPELFRNLPVVMILLTGRTRGFHAQFARAAELLRISTAAFRPVLFTDTAHTPALRACDWPVEQCLPEASSQPEENWLETAAEHLSWAQKYFGATYVFAPQSTDQAAALLEELSVAFNAQPAVRASALQTIAEAPAVRPVFGASVRGSWGQLPDGQHQQSFVSAEGHRVEAELRQVPRSGGVLVAHGQHEDALRELAEAAGWNSVAVSAGTQQGKSFAGTVLRAGAQALSQNGPAVLFGEDLVGIGADAVLEPADAEGRLTLRLRGETLRFPASAAPRVLNTVAQLI